MTAERDALAELVACKDLKDLTWRMKRDWKPQEEIDAHAREYAERKYKAWAAARAALAAQPAPSVPREATEAMIEAAIASANRRHHLPTWAEIWRAMYDAAPNHIAAPAQEPPNIDPHDNKADVIVRAPAQEPQDYDVLVVRLRDVLRNWTNVTDDEQSVIRAAADAIAALRAENAALRNANSTFATESLCHGARVGGALTCDKGPCDLCLHWQHNRAERAEAERDALRAECADLRRRLDEHIDDKERALRLSAKESTRLTTEVERLRERVRVLLGVVEAADEYHQYIHTTGDWSGLQGRHLFKAIAAARAKVQP